MPKALILKDLYQARSKLAYHWYGKGNPLAAKGEDALCLHTATPSREAALELARTLEPEIVTDDCASSTYCPLLWHFNDAPGRTHAEVLAVIDKTIERVGNIN